ncbi:MAG: hypothetical protein GX649_15790 [Chloroflexi bacterium]|nr:hypothetical protein [Chloroflexota bacterium]
MEQPPWSIEFYATARGTVPAEEFIASLPPAERAVVLRYIDLLHRFGIALREPTVRHIDGDLWEHGRAPTDCSTFALPVVAALSCTATGKKE